jgi:hypothetical protein
VQEHAVKIENEMAIVPLHDTIQPVAGVRNRKIAAYNNHSSGRSSYVSVPEGEKRLGGNSYNRFAQKSKNMAFLGENVDVYV